MESSIFCVELL